MELEARSVKSKDLQERAKSARGEHSELKNSLKKTAERLPRSALLGYSAGSSGDEAADGSVEHARLLEIGERTERGTAKLEQAYRTVLETEEVGQSTLGDLRNQRELITHTAGTLQRANEGLARSKRTIAAMGRRALGNKLIMSLMICMLGCMVLFLLYVEIFGLGKGAAAASNATG
jgi:hypothetical protein